MLLVDRLFSFDSFEVLRDFTQLNAIHEHVIQGCENILSQSLLLKLGETDWNCEETLVVEGTSQPLCQTSNGTESGSRD